MERVFFAELCLATYMS